MRQDHLPRLRARGVGPAPPNRPFLWLLIGNAVGGFAFWSYLGTVWAQAEFRFDATAVQMAILLAVYSVPFVLFVPLQGLLVDRGSPKWMNFAGYVLSVGAI